MTRHRFENILKAVRFPRNLLRAVCAAAVRDYGSYETAYHETVLEKMHHEATNKNRR